MCRVYASDVEAGVINRHTFGDWPMLQFPRLTMGADRAAYAGKRSIPARVNSAQPFPALARRLSRDFCPESFRYSLTSHRAPPRASRRERHQRMAAEACWGTTPLPMA